MRRCWFRSRNVLMCFVAVALAGCGSIRDAFGARNADQVRPLTQQETQQFIAEQGIEAVAVEINNNVTVILYRSGGTVGYDQVQSRADGTQPYSGTEAGPTNVPVSVIGAGPNELFLKVWLLDDTLAQQAHQVDVILDDGEIFTAQVDGRRGMILPTTNSRAVRSVVLLDASEQELYRHDYPSIE